MRKSVFISLIIGLLFGILPQAQAASLVTGDPVDYAIIAPTAWKSALNYYVTKKTEQGYKPRTFALEDIYANYSGTENREKILNFIKDAFNIWGISYVLLVGDINYIPSGPPEGDVVEKDNYYVLLDGSYDKYQDVYIGRLPVAYAGEVQSISTKWANYNTHGWGRSEFCLDGEDLSGTSKNDFSDYGWLAKYMDGSDIGTSIQPQDIINEMNSGYGLINWHGHGAPSMWGVHYLTPPYFYYDYEDAHYMINGNRLSFINAAISCSTGRFSVYYNIAKGFFNAPSGGAIGYFGANEDLLLGPYIYTFVANFLNNVKREYLLTGYVMPGVAFHDAMSRNGVAMSAYNLLGDPTAKMDLLPAQVDTSRPQIADIRLSANDIFPGNSTVLSASVSDNDAVGIVTAMITLPDHALLEKEMPYNKTSGRYEISIAPTETVQVGTYQIQVKARDISQNEVVAIGPSLIVVLDTEPPVITSVTITPQPAYSNVAVTIQATVTDNAGLSGLNKWAEVTKPDGSTVTITNLYSSGNFDQTSQAGVYYLIVYAKDSSGNEAVPYPNSFEVIADTEAPTITDFWVSDRMCMPSNIVKITSVASTGVTIYLYETVTDNSHIYMRGNDIIAWVEMTKPDSTEIIKNLVWQGGSFEAAYIGSTSETNLVGTYTLVYYAKDLSGNTVQSVPLLFQVGPSSNQDPILNSIGNKTVSEGSLLQFTISATDPDGDSLTYSASNLPSGASFNASTQTFSWTPTYSQAGTYTGVRFEVSDGRGGIDSEDITITVNNVNQLPTANAGPDQTVLVGQAVSFNGSGSSDPDGSIASYSWNFGDGNSGSGITTSHTYTTAATYTVILTVTDNNGATDTDSCVITVNAEPNQPIIDVKLTPDTTTVHRGDTLTYTVTLTNNTNESQTFHVAIEVWKGDETRRYIREVYRNITLAAHETKTFNRSLYVGPKTTFQDYIVRVLVGISTKNIYDQDQFRFTVVE